MENKTNNKLTFFGKIPGISVEQLIRYGKFDMKVKHFHNQYEIFYIVEGERQFFFDNKSYNAFAGDIAIIDTNLVHTTRSIAADDTGYNRVILYIDYEKMCEYDNKYPELKLVEFFHQNYGVYHLDEDQRAFFLNLYRDLRHELTDKTYGYKTRAEIDLLHWLCKFTQIKKEKLLVEASTDRPKEIAAAAVASYLEKNYMNNICLDELSDELFLSKYYLCRIFKEYSGFIITEYINIFRIKKAAQMLENSSASISEVASALGYDSVTYFERVFKKFMNVTPLKYKKTHQTITFGHEELEMNTLDDSNYLKH